jgi:hypothetical protein
MTRGIGGQSPANLQKFLKGADYPMSKDDLMDLANENGAPDEIMDILDQMPDVDFEGVTDVQECYGEIESGQDFEEDDRGQSRSQEREGRSQGRGQEQRGGQSRSQGRGRDEDKDRGESQGRQGWEQLPKNLGKSVSTLL